MQYLSRPCTAVSHNSHTVRESLVLSKNSSPDMLRMIIQEGHVPALVPLPARSGPCGRAPGTPKQSGMVHRSSRRGAWTIRAHRAMVRSKPYASAGSGRSLGCDRQVNLVRGCASLRCTCDLTLKPWRRHRIPCTATTSPGSATSVQVDGTKTS